jgi:hypothetical protein
MRRTVLPVFVGQSIRFKGSRRQGDSLAISVADDRRFNGEGRYAAIEGLDRNRGARLDWRHRESRPSTAGHRRPTGPGPAGSSQEGHEDRGSFFVFRPPGHVHRNRPSTTMHAHTFLTRQPELAPSQSMRGVALPCAAKVGRLASWRGVEPGSAYPCDTRIGSRDFGNSVGGAPV